MKHHRLLCLALFALLSGVVLGPAGASAKPSGPAPSRLLVTAREFAFTLSKPKLAAGESIIQLYNYGEDAHDLEIQRIGGPAITDLGEVSPGETGQLEMKLRRKSRYRLWCSIPGHAELGMVATLKTKAKRPPRRRH